MPEQWNKYEPTAARRHGKPGREVRPKSVTVDIHSHVAVPEAAKYVEPHLDWATIPLAHFATPETKALTANRKPTFAGGPAWTGASPISTPWASTSKSSRRRRRSATTRCR